MTDEFNDHIDKFIHSLNENSLEIYYQAFDFSNVSDSRAEFMKLNYDKSKISFLNIEMVRIEIQFSRYYIYMLDCRYVSSFCRCS